MNTFSTAYRLIHEFWAGKGDSKGNPYLWHIDQGLVYLTDADEDTRAAWCLHPMIQSYGDLSTNLSMIAEHPELTKALALALEYRNQANRYSTHKEFSSKISKLKHILPEVAEMLRADKIQNYWHLTRNRTDHPNYKDLDVYFNTWFHALDVKMAVFDHFAVLFDYASGIKEFEFTL